jgi:enoyl-CoA hydratase
MPMVFVEKSGHIARVIIRRPEALNALNDSVLKDLDDAFTSLEKDKSVRVILFMGEGTSFIAGADIKRMLDANMEEIERFLRFGQRVTMRIQNMPQPVIALVNGYALGGGCEMLLSCDFAIASDTAMIGLPEVKLGIHPGFGGTQRLPRAIPLPRAKEMIYTGAQIPASDAEKIGLVARVVKGAELYDAGEEVAGMICANGPIAVQLAKSAVNRGIEQPLKKALETELQSILETFKTKDKTEGLSAFIEKRKPQFKGE